PAGDVQLDRGGTDVGGAHAPVQSVATFDGGAEVGRVERALLVDDQPKEVVSLPAQEPHQVEALLAAAGVQVDAAEELVVASLAEGKDGEAAVVLAPVVGGDHVVAGAAPHFGKEAAVGLAREEAGDVHVGGGIQGDDVVAGVPVEAETHFAPGQQVAPHEGSQAVVVVAPAEGDAEAEVGNVAPDVRGGGVCPRAQVHRDQLEADVRQRPDQPRDLVVDGVVAAEGLDVDGGYLLEGTDGPVAEDGHGAAAAVADA